MMLRIYPLLLLITCFLTGCSYWDPSNYQDERMLDVTTSDIPRAPVVDLPPPVLAVHSEEVTAIIQDVGIHFQKDRNLYLEDAKTFYNEGGIHTIQLKMRTEDLLDPSTSRMLIVDLVDALVKKLNDNMYLMPEFVNSPFLPSNFEIYIACDSMYAVYVDPYYVKAIVFEDGIITYYAADMADNNKNCWHKRRESFQTGHQIATYQRKAKDAWDKKHNNDLDLIFGKQRFVPKEAD